MKKIIFLCASILLLASAHAQGFDWHRINVGADVSVQSSLFFFKSGLLQHHPERALHLGVNYRLWQRWEVGLYAGLTGASTSSSASESIGGGRLVGRMWVDDGYKVGWGALVQWHFFPYRNRKLVDMDMYLRAGADLTGVEADLLWFGVGFSFDITSHLTFTMSSDLGTFRFSRQLDVVTGVENMHLRSTFGLSVEL